MDMEQLSLFDTEAVYDPLASRMRPEDLDEFAGQTNLLGKGKLLRQLIEQDRIPSMIFWASGVGNHAGRDYCKENPCRICEFQRCHQWNQGNPRGDGPGRGQTAHGRKNRAFRRRDPPLQQGTAGCLSSF